MLFLFLTASLTIKIMLHFTLFFPVFGRAETSFGHSGAVFLKWMSLQLKIRLTQILSFSFVEMSYFSSVIAVFQSHFLLSSIRWQEKKSFHLIPPYPSTPQICKKYFLVLTQVLCLALKMHLLLLLLFLTTETEHIWNHRFWKNHLFLPVLNLFLNLKLPFCWTSHLRARSLKTSFLSTFLSKGICTEYLVGMRWV